MTQAQKLRKDEPHPVTALATECELTFDLGQHVALSVDEALQIVCVRHGEASSISTPGTALPVVVQLLLVIPQGLDGAFERDGAAVAG